MADIIIVPSTGVIPNNQCYYTEQARYNDYISKTVWSLPMEQLTGVWVSDIAPTDETQLWFKVDPLTGNLQVPGPFKFVSGQWVSTHPVPPLSESRILWVGTEADLWAYDGGDGSDPAVSIPTSSTGAMWEVDSDFADRLLGGVGAAFSNAADSNVVGSGTGVNVRGIYLAKRTQRQFYSA